MERRGFMPHGSAAEHKTVTHRVTVLLSCICLSAISRRVLGSCQSQLTTENPPRCQPLPAALFFPVKREIIEENRYSFFPVGFGMLGAGDYSRLDESAGGGQELGGVEYGL